MLPGQVRVTPSFRSRQVPYIHHFISSPSHSSQISEKKNPSTLKDVRVFAFSAIADNTDFHRLLKNQGCRISGTAEFADHHAYSPKELEHIGRAAVSAGAEILATTEKDHSKLPANAGWPLPLVVLGVLPSFSGEENDFDEFLKDTVGKVVHRV
jgi:tetraacyldisaccharide-1-P 4'-kinase